MGRDSLAHEAWQSVPGSGGEAARAPVGTGVWEVVTATGGLGEEGLWGGGQSPSPLTGMAEPWGLELGWHEGDFRGRARGLRWPQGAELGSVLRPLRCESARL